ncbi:MAG: TIGR04282 family arsenosugar biosynthesis glycosyltransferase, partial [Bacteriovorax sp.]
IEAYWAVAEKDQLSHPLWNSFKAIPQGNGELGERLNAVYSKLQKKHRKVFLIGADLPHLDSKTLLRAHHRLTSSSTYVLGETEDGGFYLFGGRGIIERAIWNSVPYSSEKTSSVLVQKLGKSNFIFLDKNFDIDYQDDLKRLLTIERDGLLPEQIDIINWLQKNPQLT